jgi:hypothetical protein
MLIKEHRLRVFEKTMLRRIYGTVGWRLLVREELHDFCC